MSSRISIAKPRKGRRKDAPMRGFIYGTEGVGKSSFVADAPAPLFFDSSGGTDELDVQRVPYPPDGELVWADLLDVVKQLATEKHSFKSLVVDELGAVEALAWQHICKRDGKANIEDYGFSKGYEIVLREWRILLRQLERLREKRSINVFFLGHSQVKKFANPEDEDFDRYVPLVHHKLSGVLKQWCDFVFFARFEELVDVDKNKRKRGQSTGVHLLHTTRTAAYDAKNRYGLPETLLLDWNEFMAAKEAGAPQTAAESIEELESIARAVGGELATKIKGGIERAKGDASKLARLADWARGKQQQQQQPSEGTEAA